MNKTTLTTNADKFIREGIKETIAVRKNFQVMNLHMINAGEFFIQARESCDEGNFSMLLESYKTEIGRSTVYRFISYVEWGLELASKDAPKLTGNRMKLLDHLKHMVVQSPKPLVAILRALDDEEGHPLMRPFGEYDAVKYSRQKLLGKGAQYEFQFATVVSSLEVLAHFGDENYQFIYPEGKDTVEYMAEVETKLETALARVRNVKQNGRVIEA